MPSIEDALERLEAGDRHTAAQICNDLVADDTTNLPARFLLATIAKEDGRPEEAVDQYRTIAEIDPLNALANFRLAYVHVRNNDWQTASHHFATVINHTDQPKLLCTSLYELCLCLLHQDNQPDAVTNAKKLREQIHNPETIKLINPELRQSFCSLTALLLGDDELATIYVQLKRPKHPYALAGKVAQHQTTQAWCEDNNAPFHLITPPQQISLTGRSGGQDQWAYETAPCFHATIPGGRYVTGWDFAVASDGTVLSDTGYMPIAVSGGLVPHFFDPFYSETHMIRPGLERNEALDCDAVFLSGSWGNHTPHWMVDFLPRLRVRTVLNGGNTKFAVPETLSDRNQDLLKYFDITTDDLIVCKSDTTYTFRNLHIFQPGTSNFPAPENVQFVREGLARAAVRPKGKKGGRFFLTRESTGTRLIHNTDEFNQLLDQYGFETLDLAVASIDEQIAMVKSAGLLLGPVGSNLFAFYYVPEGCRVIELTPDPSHNQVVGPSCLLAGLHHEFFLCEAKYPDSLPKNRATYSYDLIVDCKALDGILAERLDR